MPSLAIHRSRHLIPPFRLRRPERLDEVSRLLAEEPGAAMLAGGLDLINEMKLGNAPEVVIALGGVSELRGIRVEAGGEAVLIGAMARHDELARDPAVTARLPDLAAAWDRIANIRVRMQGTVMGNLLACRPAYEAAMLLGCADAVVLAGDLAMPIAAARPCRDAVAAAGGFAHGIRIPLPGRGIRRRILHDRSLRPALTVTLRLDEIGGTVTRACAALGGCHGWPLFREIELQGIVVNELARHAEGAARAAFSGLPPMTVPWSGAPGYRERMASILLRRLIEGAGP